MSNENIILMVIMVKKKLPNCTNVPGTMLTALHAYHMSSPQWPYDTGSAILLILWVEKIDGWDLLSLYVLFRPQTATDLTKPNSFQ